MNTQQQMFGPAHLATNPNLERQLVGALTPF